MGNREHKKVKCPMCGKAMKLSTIGLELVPGTQTYTATESFEHYCKGSVSYRKLRKHKGVWHSTDTSVQRVDQHGNIKVSIDSGKTVNICKIIEKTINIDYGRGL